MGESKFKCEECGGVFDKEWSDDEAQIEFEQNFPLGHLGDGIAVVCDDCYQEIMG